MQAPHRSKEEKSLLRFKSQRPKLVELVSLNHRNSPCYWLCGQIYRRRYAFRCIVALKPSKPPPSDPTLSYDPMLAPTLSTFPLSLLVPHGFIVLVYSVICGFYSTIPLLTSLSCPPLRRRRVLRSLCLIRGILMLDTFH